LTVYMTVNRALATDRRADAQLPASHSDRYADTDRVEDR
jgi:hypothetical protein